MERLTDNEKKTEPLDERVAINLLSIIKTNTKTGIREYAMIDLFLGTGIRRDELAKLDIQDVHISQTRSSTITVRKGKGDKTRTIPLARAQKESLTKWLEVRGDNTREIKSDTLFITRLGTRPIGELIHKTNCRKDRGLRNQLLELSKTRPSRLSKAKKRGNRWDLIIVKASRSIERRMKMLIFIIINIQ